eukprot:TRINITY_DN4581_c0_g2_i4.p1 TRINITY_DN4581_c0_g2~~TRINITY_DN4581_c0_g2_i4.p1  ORF type:complete len:566 (+),score=66.57 TRINITY_DN4581_c0_g2_i4:92-1789(+)
MLGMDLENASPHKELTSRMTQLHLPAEFLTPEKETLSRVRSTNFGLNSSRNQSKTYSFLLDSPKWTSSQIHASLVKAKNSFEVPISRFEMTHHPPLQRPSNKQNKSKKPKNERDLWRKDSIDLLRKKGFDLHSIKRKPSSSTKKNRDNMLFLHSSIEGEQKKQLSNTINITDSERVKTVLETSHSCLQTSIVADTFGQERAKSQSNLKISAFQSDLQSLLTSISVTKPRTPANKKPDQLKTTVEANRGSPKNYLADILNVKGSPKYANGYISSFLKYRVQTPQPIVSTKSKKEIRKILMSPSKNIPKVQPITNDYYMSKLRQARSASEDSELYCFLEHFLQNHQALLLCTRLIFTEFPEKPSLLLPDFPKGKEKKTLIFDLDETIIRCNESREAHYDYTLDIQIPHGPSLTVGISVRPHALDTIRELAKDFEIIIFTASHQFYADTVLDSLDPKGELFQHRLYRTSCSQSAEGFFVKDLRVIANRKLKDMVLIDNSAYSFGLQPENGIPILPYYNNKGDCEFIALGEFLRNLASAEDVREVNRETFKLHLYATSDNPNKILDRIL